MSIPLPILDVRAPFVPLEHLDHLWFQVGGTVCNLTCRHCFISCSPHNHSFGFLDLYTVRLRILESRPLGVKEYYFTGGEPFLNPDMVAILEFTLKHGPATVLTNATVFKDEWLVRLRKAEENSLFSLEFRVSLDGATAADNDPIRGEGSFERTMKGVRQLVEHGFLPILTVARTRDDQNDQELFHDFTQLLREIDYSRPRIKLLPTLRLGAEIDRQRGYHAEERVTPEMLEDYDISQLICQHSRIVTDRGVAVCPILIEAPDAHLSMTLADSLQSFSLRHHACYTCYQYGAICSNASGGRHDA